MSEALLADARRALGHMPAVLDALLSGLDEAAARTRPAPDEWAPVEIVCHLRDEETEDFGARVRVIAKRGKKFTPIDPERWAVDRKYLEDDGPGALAAFRERRSASLAFLDTLKPDGLTRAAPLGRTGALSGLDLLAAWVAHDRLHLAQLASTLARGWATWCTPLRVDYAGSISYTGG